MRDFINELVLAGFSLAVVGGKLEVVPGSRLNNEQRDTIQDNRQAIITELTGPEMPLAVKRAMGKALSIEEEQALEDQAYQDECLRHVEAACRKLQKPSQGQVGGRREAMSVCFKRWQD